MHTSEYEAMAEKIASDYIANGASMNTAIAKYAEDKDLNPEKVKRLVEFSNRAAFKKHYEKEENRKDMDFDVADSDKVLDTLYEKNDSDDDDDTTSESTDDASKVDPLSELEDKHLELKETSKDEEKEKVASERLPLKDLYEPHISQKVAFEVKDLPRLEKTAGELESRIRGCEQRYHESLVALGNSLNTYYDRVDYNQFEKTASRHGPDSLTPLRDLRGYTGKNTDRPLALDTDKYYQIKTANEGRAQELFDSCLKLNREQVQNIKGLKYINEKIAEAKEWLRTG